MADCQSEIRSIIRQVSREQESMGCELRNNAEGQAVMREAMAQVQTELARLAGKVSAVSDQIVKGNQDMAEVTAARDRAEARATSMSRRLDQAHQEIARLIAARDKQERRQTLMSNQINELVRSANAHEASIATLTEEHIGMLNEEKSIRQRHNSLSNRVEAVARNATAAMNLATSADASVKRLVPIVKRIADSNNTVGAKVAALSSDMKETHSYVKLATNVVVNGATISKRTGNPHNRRFESMIIPLYQHTPVNGQ